MPHLSTEQLKQLREGITKGAWVRNEFNYVKSQSNNFNICRTYYLTGNAKRDAEAIALLPDLLDELISLREKMEGLKQKLLKMSEGYREVGCPEEESAIDAVIALLDQ